MKKKMSIVLFTSFALLMFTIIGVSAKVGWTNEGWSGLNWHLKACNSKTTVFDTPSYSYMSATAKIGSKQVKKEQRIPAPNTSVHAVTSSGYNETCESWGNAY